MQLILIDSIIIRRQSIRGYDYHTIEHAFDGQLYASECNFA